MSLQAAFRSARSALATNAFQTNTLTRNVSGAETKGYARKIALVEPALPGSANAVRLSRATDLALQSAALSARATAQGSDAVAKALDTLQNTVGDASLEASPSARISKLKTALLQAASAPQDRASLAAAVDAAMSLASGLADATSIVQNVRLQADRDMAASVANVNSLLGSYESINASVVSGQANGRDISEALDRRDAILENLAEEISFTTVAGENGDLSLYSDSGVPLFQGTARTVSMEATTAFAAGVVGHAVHIDGVAVTGAAAAMPLRAGALAGLSEIRDAVSVDYQAQIDAVATGLILAFSQTDSSGGAGAARTGLFGWSGGPALPTYGMTGLAAQIRVDPTVEANPALLRDGGIGNDGAYVYNASGSATYSSRLYALVEAIGAPQPFQAPGLPLRLSVADMASQSEAWFESARQNATEQSTQANALLVQTSAAFSNAVGVNIDDQMAQMLDLENSYQASAKMMAAIDRMYAALFGAVQSA